ncbi:MFS transporter [Candidatus Acidianus copahuensis]|uniref:MFS transporter n=1 Tax=Candidatus Acidianus copahuensis TaxID=1160895 RepID=A0A031LSM6_9CREN|nr:MFS transporter [Candidatus Acidianus copahuensis]EZQ11387.1 MFS transporter [Candidatus Acidianus copahuensis]
MKGGWSFRSFEIKNVLTAGMGMFTDGYELYAISLVFYLLESSIHMSKIQEGVLVAGSYYGAAISAIIMGFLSDRLGRRFMYGLDVFLMTLGIIGQSISQNYTQILLFRLILGMGIGADYVLSPIIAAENSSPKNRGKVMIVTFAVLWGLGAVAAAFVEQILLIANVSPSLVWRLVFLAGSIPAFSVFYLRRKIPETYKFLTKIKPIKKELERLEKEVGNVVVEVDRTPFKKRLLTSSGFIIVASLLWLLYDMYSSTFAIYGPITIAANLGLTPIAFTYAAQLFAGLPGQFISISLVDRIGRKPLIVIGYAGVFIWLLMYSLLLMRPSLFGINLSGTGQISSVTLTGIGAILGFSFYLLNYLFAAIGPASIIGSAMLAPELVPTKIRGTGQAISVATDRLSAALSITAFPLLLSNYGLGALLAVYAIIALSSSLITLIVIPETKGVSLS